MNTNLIHKALQIYIRNVDRTNYLEILRVKQEEYFYRTANDDLSFVNSLEQNIDLTIERAIQNLFSD